MSQTSYMPEVSAVRTTLVGPIFEPLHDPVFFAQAYLDREGATVA